MHHHDAGHDNNAGDRRDIADEIEAELVVKRGIGGVARRGQKKRVAVRRRAHDRFGRQIRARAGPVLDHDRLPEPLGEPLRDQTRGDVGGAAGGKSDEQAYRTARIALR
jgi:hypothetical protein